MIGVASFDVGIIAISSKVPFWQWRNSCSVGSAEGRIVRLLKTSKDATESSSTIALESKMKLIQLFSTILTTWGMSAVDANEKEFAFPVVASTTTVTRWFCWAKVLEIFTNDFWSATLTVLRLTVFDSQEITNDIKINKSFILKEVFSTDCPFFRINSFYFMSFDRFTNETVFSLPCHFICNKLETKLLTIFNRMYFYPHLILTRNDCFKFVSFSKVLI